MTPEQDEAFREMTALTQDLGLYAEAPGFYCCLDPDCEHALRPACD